jgi:cold shock CspA family protein
MTVQPLRGVVTWFNQVSDYGFITCDEGGPERYVRGGNVVRTSTPLLAGVRVAFEPRAGGMGPEAINVRRLAPIRRRSSGSFEPARRHGAFDPRFPQREPRAAALPPRTSVRNGNGGSGWYAFAARCFPDRRRHDLEALKAFESYGDGSSRGQITTEPADAPRRGPSTETGSPLRNRARSGKRVRRGERVATAAVSDWEGEGGATP